jgi:hypothetical protein
LSLIIREGHVLKVFENGAEGNIGTKERLNSRWLQKVHNEDLHKMYSSPRAITVIKSMRMRWVGHVEHTNRRNSYNILEEQLI